MSAPIASRPPVLEIAVQDPAGAATAIAHGADQVELCSALAATGGLTPSRGLVCEVAAAVREAAAAAGRSGGVAVLVRPREGGFVYTPVEVAIMRRDIAELSAIDGVTAVVTGALTPEAAVDEPVMRTLLDAAGDTPVVFHRAIDVVEDPVPMLGELIGLGCARVLTSGGAARAGDGADTLARLVNAAKGRIEILAGGGVDLDAVPALIAAGVDGIHLSASRQVPTTPAGPGGGASTISATDGELVAAIAALLGR